MNWFQSADAGVFIHALGSFVVSVLAGLPTILPLLFAAQPSIDPTTQGFLLALANLLANAAISAARNNGTETLKVGTPMQHTPILYTPPPPQPPTIPPVV